MVELGENDRWVPAIANPGCLGCSNEREFSARLVPTQVGQTVWLARMRSAGSTIVACAGSPRLNVREPGRLRILQLNMRCLIDDWDARRSLMAAAIVVADPDLIGLQEVCVGQGVTTWPS
jgi:hypothetical protein